MLGRRTHGDSPAALWAPSPSRLLPEAGTPGARMRGRKLGFRNEGRLRSFCGTVRSKHTAQSRTFRRRLTEEERSPRPPGRGHGEGGSECGPQVSPVHRVSPVRPWGTQPTSRTPAALS